ncbi:MAG: PEGA domain-containing protein [Ignavibacteria bacterium]|nr:PEGA domain-containing protein [Ignavibacteria bacterium]
MKNRIFQKFVIFLAISIFLYGCGTIWNGTSDKISINSTPSSAAVTIKNENGAMVNTGKTPMTIKLSKKHDYTVAINLNGYKEQVVNVNSSLNALWLLGNIFLLWWHSRNCS